MGLRYPTQVQSTVPAIASFLDSPTPLLRSRAVNALGRIGRGSFPVIEPYWASLFRFASDVDAGVRLSFVWASENIAVNSPDVYAEHLPVFAALLHDADDIQGAHTQGPLLMAHPISRRPFSWTERSSSPCCAGPPHWRIGTYDGSASIPCST